MNLRFAQTDYEFMVMTVCPRPRHRDLLLLGIIKGKVTLQASNCASWLSPKEAVPSYSFQAVLHLAEQSRQLLMNVGACDAVTSSCS